MNFKLGNKKIAIFIIILILLLIAGGVFWWWENNKKKEGIIVEFEPPKNYVIRETPEGRIVENEKTGLIFKIPDTWKVEINEYKKGEGIVEIFSSDVSFYPNTKLPKNGCGIAISIEYKGLEETAGLINFIKEIQTNQDTEANRNKTVIDVSYYPALKSMIFYKPEMGQGFKVEVPINNSRTYIFNTFFPSEEEKCVDEFNKFLETVEIK